MSKSDQNAAKQAAQGQISQNNANESSANTQLQGILGTAQSTAASILPGITSGYSDLASTGGGVDPNSQAAYQNLAAGLPQATNLATTGGLDPATIDAMKSEASQAARSTYQTSADQVARTAAATGGYGSTAALQDQLAREGSNAASQAVNNSQATIGQLQQSGQIAGVSALGTEMASGAGGLAATQQNVTGNKLAALGGSTNIYGMNEQQVTSTVGQILQNYQQTGQLNNQDLAILTNLANQPGVFDKIVSTLGTLGGAAAGIIKAVKS